jgi:TonB-linked SusC/RagA family outer membrane protein
MKKNDPKQRHRRCPALRKMLKIMKLATLLFFVALLQVAANSYSQTRLSLKFEKETLESVFSKIEANSEFSIFYKNDLIRDTKEVSGDYKNASVNEILDQVLKAENLTYTVKNKLIMIVPKEGSGEEINLQQQKSVSGKVTDSTGSPLPGVSVVVKGTTTGVITDMDGKYTLPKVPENATLQFSFVGMKSQEIAVGNKTTINVILADETIGIDEVVAIGYGTVRRSDLTGSVSSLNSYQIIQGTATSASRAIQGKSAGVQVTQKSGRPGDDVIIRIRGGNSLSGGNDPLYVIDGFPVDKLGADFNPEDIASMEILKDAAATAIYGSRGANGVVLITTKRGKEGKGKVSYHTYYGVQNLRKKLDLLGKDEYVAMQNEIAQKEGGKILTPSEIASLPDNDWQDLAYRNAIMQSYQISGSGGNESARFYSALNYMDQEGILKGSDYNRIALRVNGDIQLNKKLNLKANVNLSRSIDNNGNFAADGYGAIPFQAIVMPPTVPILDTNGKYTVFQGTPWGGNNPVGYAEMEKNVTTQYRVISNVDLNYQIIDDLSLKITAGIDFNNSTNDSYSKIGISNGGPGTGQASKLMSKSYTFINENILNYSKQINKDNRINLMAGYSYQESKFDRISGSASGFVSDIFENNLIQSGTSPSPPNSTYNDSKLISYIGRVNYSVMDRYLLTLTGRYDGSSKFGEDNKFAFFPSIALAWRVTEEAFMKDFDLISNFKLRGSMGQAGNQAISPYQTLDRLSTNVPVFGGIRTVGFVASGFSNQGLKWETTTQVDFGFDLGFLENRINIVADYYKKNTTDLLYNATLPPSSGYSSSVRNVGEIENKGFEFEIAYRNLQGAVKWNPSFNISFNKTVVADLGTDNNGNIIKRIDSPIAGGNWFPLFLGEAPFQLYGYELDGIYQTDAEAAALEPGKKAGDYRTMDLKKDGVINGDDQTLLSHLQPNFIFGFNNIINYSFSSKYKRRNINLFMDKNWYQLYNKYSFV